jgi:low affinity Fe/Cu permease
VELIWFGLSLMVLAFGLFIHLDASSATVEIILFQIIAGIGTGFSYSGPLLALQAQISAKDNATATSTYGFIRNLSMAISVVIGGVVFQNGMASQASVLTEKLGDSIASKLSGKEAAANVLSLNELNEVQKTVARAAYATSLRKMWILFTCTAACGLIVSAFVSKKVLSKVHEETKTGLETEDKKPQDVVET